MRYMHDHRVTDVEREHLNLNVPGEPVQDAPCRGGLKEAHWRTEDREGHPLM